MASVHVWGSGDGATDDQFEGGAEVLNRFPAAPRRVRLARGRRNDDGPRASQQAHPMRRLDANPACEFTLHDSATGGLYIP